jgi:cytochrome o ubiquinol oxidase subunit 2
VVLGLFIVLPVFALLFGIAWKYREDNTKARYTPNAKGNTWLEILWWGVPAIIIVILSFVTWQSSHALDPYKKIDSDKDHITVQVVALQWKWLFIYPDYGVASLNYLPFPEKTPVRFEITSDAPMNAFWIPNLGGMVYAMSGMSTMLHLEANSTGVYRGSSANISGAGFSKMNFNAQSMSQADFDTWVNTARTSTYELDLENYEYIAKPSIGDAPEVFRLTEPDLYSEIMMKYMMPGMTHGHGHGMGM